MVSRITPCVLLFGDYPALARRCLDSIFDRAPNMARHLRVGANAIGHATAAYLDELVARGRLRRTNIYESSVNLHKYPMMRRIFTDPDNQITTEFVCWFDDDSYVKAANFDWEAAVVAAMQDADMVGSIYVLAGGFQGQQHLWVMDQPWYNGREVAPGHKPRFATGGWWCIRTEILRRHDWPSPELDHRGGDVMLGELCRQQGYRLRAFSQGVAINADEQGRESKAKRRGFDQQPIGVDYVPSVTTAVHRAMLRAPALPSGPATKTILELDL